MKTKIIIYILGTVIMQSCSFRQKEMQENSLTVLIDFGNNKPVKKSTIAWKENITALEALQSAAIVATHPVGSYVFVTTIDSLYGVRGKTAWYYKVNGQSSGVLAISKRLQPGDTLLWQYKKDVCSHTVDQCNPEPRIDEKLSCLPGDQP